MSFVLGLTGSIGMGKSTTAQMFRELGVPVWDADGAVHALYAPGGAAVGPVAALVPSALRDGGIDRAALRAALAADPGLILHLNAAVHPLVAADRAAWLVRQSVPVVVLDVPLLFEGGGDDGCDAVAVVTAPPEVQRARVLARGMSEGDFALILSRQMKDADKRARADYVIDTRTMEGARAQVAAILRQIGGRDA